MRNEMEQTVADVYEEDGNAARGLVFGALLGSGLWGLILAVFMVLR